LERRGRRLQHLDSPKSRFEIASIAWKTLMAHSRQRLDFVL
jgi:hypothetical protein